MNDQSESGSLEEDRVFCPEQLIERCLGKIDFAERVLDVFMSNVQSDVDELLAAVQAGDNRQLVQTAHRIKGSAASISACRMQRLMAEIEEAGRQHLEIPEVESLQRRIQIESQSLERVLTCWRSEDRAVTVKANESLRHLPLWRNAF